MFIQICKKRINILVLMVGFIIFVSCNGVSNEKPNKVNISSNKTEIITLNNTTMVTNSPSILNTEIKKLDTSKIEILEKYKNISPKQWGDRIKGIKTKFKTDKSEVALTFDACGGDSGNGYDKELIDFLTINKIKATLFINNRWINKNNEIFLNLSKNELFEIENHGLEHRPLSVSNKEIYGINGTNSPERVIDEIYKNKEKIESITKKQSKYFRSGTAYYDDISVKIANDLGIEIIGFDVNGDFGATASVSDIVKSCNKVKNGSILIFHMNQPGKNTFEGFKEAYKELNSKKIEFVKIEERELID